MHQKDAEISCCSLCPSMVLVLLFWCTLLSKDLIVARFCPTTEYFLEDLLAIFFPWVELLQTILQSSLDFSFFKWKVTSNIDTWWLWSLYMEGENFTIPSAPGISHLLSDYQFTKELWFSFGTSGKANRHCIQRLCLCC